MITRSSYLIILLLSISSLACAENKSGNSQESLQPPNGQYFALPSNLTNVVVSQDQRFVIQEVITGLRVPWAMAFLPDGTMLITERAGTLRFVKDGVLQSEPVRGVPEVYARGQGGLMDVVLHPDYSVNGWIYLSYSHPGEGGGHTSIMRAKLRNNELVDKEVIFRGGPNTTNGRHFGSKIAFDNDGYLYFTIGERGFMPNAQNLSNASGKSFRLYDDGSVPADNPFVNRPGARPEIFTFGNRNPQGLVLHPVTGEMWSHEHGPRGGDEINILRAGNNYGWPEITFGIEYDGTIITTDTAKAGMEQPLHYWLPSIAASGMTFITGNTYPNWEGDLMSGSLILRFLQRTVLDGEKVVKEEKLIEGIGRVRDVRQAPDGYLYLAVETGGKIIRLIPVN